MNIAGQSFDISMPSQGAGVRGLIFGDPCFTSEYIVCVYRKPFDMFNRSTMIMNEIFKHEDVHFWVRDNSLLLMCPSTLFVHLVTVYRF